MSDHNAKLAIDGGDKIAPEGLPSPMGYGAALVGEEEKANVLEVLERKTLSRWMVSAEKSFVGKFEDVVREQKNVPYVIATNSGTSALYTALMALGIGPGDEVIVPSFGWVSCGSTVVSAGAVPVVAEINETLTIDPDDIERKLSPNTRAIMVVHWRGRPADMDRIMDIARSRDLLVIEDAAQANGAFYRGKPVGTIGHCGTFSMNPMKLATSGEGGIVVTRDPKVYARALWISGSYIPYKLLQSESPDIAGSDVPPSLALRMSEICGAVAVEQQQKLLGMLDTFRSRRREVLAGIQGIDSLKPCPSNDDDGDCGWTLPFLFDTPERAKFFFEALQAEGITTASVKMTGFLGGDLKGLITHHVSIGATPDMKPSPNDLMYACEWPFLTGRYGYTDKLNPWKLAEQSTKPSDDFMPRSLDILERVAVVGMNPMLEASHSELIVKALHKVAAAMSAQG